jgi:N-acetylglucosaminyl-diphospho-decaprenol L-rhamnosyltransferase
LRNRLPKTCLIFNSNVGFAKAVNQGIRQSSGKFILLLNPDAKLLDDGIRQALDFMQNTERVGMVGPKIVDNQGSIQDSARSFMTLGKLASRNFRRFLNVASGGILDKIDYTKTQSVDWISGACMLIRRSAVDEVGLMDERYFMYVEDMDWCRRFWLKGWEVWYLTQWTIEHNAGRASTSNFSITNRLMRIHLNSLFKYYVKWLFKKIPQKPTI